jgi:hypothetical protein
MNLRSRTRVRERRCELRAVRTRTRAIGSGSINVAKATMWGSARTTGTAAQQLQ